MADRMALDRSVRTFDRAGHLHIETAPISKANVSPYFGGEIPGHEALGLDPDRIYHLFRDPAELAKAAGTFTGKPIVLKHRPQTAADHSRDLTVGAVGEATFQAPYLRAPLVVWDGAGIEAIESKRQRELSCGYFYRADMTPGTVNGERYDGRMTEIVGNHVALVDAGRAGPDVVVGDRALPAWFVRFAASRRSTLQAKDQKMADPMNDVLQAEAVNLKMIEAFRAFLQPKLSTDDMQAFDLLWMPLMNTQVGNGDPMDFNGVLAGDRRTARPAAPAPGFSDRFPSAVPLKLG